MSGLANLGSPQRLAEERQHRRAAKQQQCACGFRDLSAGQSKGSIKVGGVVPPTMSVPTRSQSGSSCASRVHA